MERRIIIGFSFLFLLSEIGELVSCGSCIEPEKHALLKFKASILEIPYRNLSSWNPKTNCCQWDGISCHNVTGHVLKLDLHFLEAIVVDPSLLELQHLVYLDLSWKDFNGISIPSFFGSMKLLRYLSISDANFTGKIPTNLGGNLTDLQFLDLSWNHLYINDMSWVSQLQSLQYLNMSDVYFGEAHNLFQVLHMLPSLLELQLQSCGLGNLSTFLPSINFTNNAKVQLLNLADNEIDGRILHAFQNWTSLETLDLHLSSLSSLPLWFGEFKNLVTLYLSSNTFSGPIPIALRNLTTLQELDLSSNNFSSVPLWLGELRSLYYLGISNNQITPTMEISVSQILKSMCHLRFLFFSNSNFQGEAFDDSNFNGCTKYDIEKLRLDNNNLSGHLPTWIGYLGKLNELYLANNYFSGNIPQGLGQLVNLTDLNLSNNSLSGLIPQSLGQLVNLMFLDLSNNYLSGNIPQSLGQLVNLTSLDLSNNYLSGNIPQRICHLEYLMSLDLSHNNFSGEIPNCWRDKHPSGLTEINFSFNTLSGGFPISIGNLSSLLWLHLNKNYLEGKLPLTLKNLKQLRILDLGENNFFGSIPSWPVNTFPTLQILRLRDNILEGNIPSNLCQLKSLQILDLANNNLSGSIPYCIGHLTKMTEDSVNLYESIIQDDDAYFAISNNNDIESEWHDQDVKQVMKGIEFDIIGILRLEVNLDLSNNNLVGSIPLELFSLIGLIGLNLSHNHLKGEIPENVGNMKSLESFDISCNHISGPIPKSVSKLTALSHLNVSYNNLSGPIPTDNQFLTLNDPSIYIGNCYLCGIPLPNKCQVDEPHQVPEAKRLEDEGDLEKVWFYFVIAIGFFVGFWSAIGTLVLKKRWRYACFRRVEDVADEIYVFTSIKIARLKRLLTNHVHG